MPKAGRRLDILFAEYGFAAVCVFTAGGVWSRFPYTGSSGSLRSSVSLPLRPAASTAPHLRLRMHQPLPMSWLDCVRELGWRSPPGAELRGGRRLTGGHHPQRAARCRMAHHRTRPPLAVWGRVRGVVYTAAVNDGFVWPLSAALLAEGLDVAAVLVMAAQLMVDFVCGRHPAWTFR